MSTPPASRPENFPRAYRFLLDAAASAPEWIAGYLDRNKLLYLAAFSFIYFLGTVFVSSVKYVWVDEVLTAYMTRLSVSDLLKALATGTDIHPPLFHLITRLFTGTMGESPVALRMPAILGGWLTCICLFVFLSRRSRTIYAAVAMLVPFLTIASIYTTDARGYGIALGFCAVALVCWQSAAERHPRKLALAGLALGLAAAVSCQYYMVLMAAAIGVGEVVRSFSRKQIDAPVWIALAAGVVPLPAHLWLIRAAMTFTIKGPSALDFAALWNAYRAFLHRAVWPAAVIIAGVLIYRVCFERGVEQSRRSSESGLRAAEMTIGVALFFAVAAAFVLGKLGGGLFYPRYGICAVLGISILFVSALTMYDRARPVAGAAAFVVLSAVFVRQVFAGRDFRFSVPALISQADPSMPIVMQNPFRFTEMGYSAPPDVVSRLYYLASPEASRRYINDDDNDRGLLLLKEWVPLQVEEPDQFLEAHKTFLVCRTGTWGWLLDNLADRGAAITQLRTGGQETLFYVSMPGAKAKVP